MHAGIPKQFLVAAGKPLLMHTLQRFYDYSAEIKIILVLPDPFKAYWESLCRKFSFEVPCIFASGGETRYFSVKSGLKHTGDESLVAVHDGVRPLVSADTIQRVFKIAAAEGNAVPVVNVNQTMRKISGSDSHTVNRDEYRLVQTPQCFRADILKKAYRIEYEDRFTDDAIVVEASGVKICLVQGNPENIKITHPSELKIADALLKQ
ncbi:MAG: 2-C-methyl-D-erythritol 4-phosphate cytidylyltransferase [Bacteroidales bacterium]|nr:2-C-methyl-D-erythritol 4-phosphate cytidylyltransferase [Bacteroidales bacterium]